MSLAYLDPGTIGSALSCAWRTQLNTSESPSNDGKWDTKGANGDDIGLYGGLTDSIPASSLTLETSSGTVKTTAITCSTNQVDNKNGDTPLTVTVDLSYQYNTTTSSTHTLVESVTNGTKFTINVYEVVTVDGLSVPVAFQFVSTESTSTASSTQTKEVQETVTVAAGKICDVALCAEVQVITIPFTFAVKVTGTTETWFENKVNDHYNYSTDAGTAFGWIRNDNCARSDSSSYSDAGSGIGEVTLTGTVTVTQTVNFTITQSDLTS